MRKFQHIFFRFVCFCLIAFSAAVLAPRAQAASTLTASENCVAFIKTVEGFSPQPYYDYSQYTVGYGTRCPTEKYFEYKANGIPRPEAEALLRVFLAEIGDTLNKNFIDKYQLSLNQNQFDALVSFSFNIGTGWITYDSSLRNAILRNAGEDEMVYAFSLYCTAGGKYLPGLVTRRLCEANIYLNGVYHQSVSDAYGYVYYDANGGSLTYRVQGYISSYTPAPVASALKNNDTFLGWYTSLKGGTQVTALDQSVSGRTLFARWQSSENPENQPAASTTVKVTGDVVNVRSGPGTNYSIVRKAYQNEVLTISHVSHITSMRWGNFQDGWISLDYTNYDDVINGTADSGSTANPPQDAAPPANGNGSVSNTTPSNPILASGIVKVNDALRIRSGPGTGYAVVGFLFNGKEVDILEQQSDGAMVWGRIDKGWVSMDYIVTNTIQGDIPPATVQPSVPQQQPTQPPQQTPEQQPTEPPQQIPEQQPTEPPQQIPEQQPTEPPQQIPEQQPTQPPEQGAANTTFQPVPGTIRADALRIRTGPGTEHPIAGFYYQDQSVVITMVTQVDSVSWGKTDKGWINMDYVVTGSFIEVPTEQPTEGRRMTVIGDCLRVRKGTGTNYRISQLLYYGDTITVYETVSVDGTLWGRVDNGWVCMDYVS
ncbi:MAG: SH3 domain-containing protein [Oscillospiraceae bacterium]